VTPTLRFPEFAGAWQPKHGDNAFKSRRQRAKEGLPLYSVTIDQGMVRRDSLDREFASNAPDEANLRVFKDDHVYNMMRMWQGAVGRAPEDCMVSPAYVVLQPKPDTVPAFFDHWFKRRRSIYLLWAYSYGLTSDRLRLYARDFGRVPMALPAFDEQRRIADFLGVVDERIRLLQRRRGALAQYRTGVMQRLFDQSIRFTHDDGTAFPDWEEKRLDRLATFHRGGFLPKSDLDPEAPFSCIHYGELFTKYGEIIRLIKSRTAKSESPVGLRGDIIMPSSDVTPHGLAKASALLVEGVRLGGDINIIRPKNGDMLAEFFSYWVCGHRKKLIRLVSGTTVKHMYSSDLKSLVVSLPHKDEQRKIVDCLSALDDKIAAVSAQITHMQAFKKGLLQQMFV
jgi:type I restriction enzyme, S subunit